MRDPAEASPDEVRRALQRRFLSATVAGPGSPLVTGHPDVAAEVAMSIVGPVLEAMVGEIARLRVRVALLEAALTEILSGYRPYPRPEDRDYYRPLPSSAAALGRWREIAAPRIGTEGQQR